MKTKAKMERQINQITPEVYAGIAIALRRKHGWGYGRINALFVETEKIWTDATDSGKNILEICEEETGIELRSK